MIPVQALQKNSFTDCSKAVLFVDHSCYFCLVLLCFRVPLFIGALWSPAGKMLTSWLSFVMSNCVVVTLPLVSWVRCDALLYRFLIFALFLILSYEHEYITSSPMGKDRSPWSQ